MQKSKKIAICSGLFIATVFMAKAATFVPTYAPGDNPPDFASAPLLYKMAGVLDPATFDPAESSLSAIGDKVEALKVKLEAL